GGQQGGERVAKRGTRDQVGEELAGAPEALQTVLQQQVFLALKVQIEGRLGHARGGGDRLDRRRLDAGAQEESVRGLADASASRFPARENGLARSDGTHGRNAPFYFTLVSQTTPAKSAVYDQYA